MKKHIPFILFLLLYLSALTYKIVVHQTPFFDWDEPLYVRGGLEMIQSRSFLLPVWLGVPWYDKPPLTTLLYGIVAFIKPAEVSTRLFTLAMTGFILSGIYALYYRYTKEVVTSLLTVIATAFAVVFIQRAQVVNLDVFLLSGWIGYCLFRKKPIAATLFLLLSVQSKSLLGFFPLVIYSLAYIVSLLRHEKTWAEVKRQLLIIILQAIVLSGWYIAMFILYGNSFLYAHFFESHLMRVTASIESHFGTRTFYLEALWNEMKFMVIPAIAGTALLLYEWIVKKRSTMSMATLTLFVPWFIFLNLTKTKISWYIYPVLGQFYFLAFYPLSYLPRYLKYAIAGLAIVYLCYTGIVTRNMMGTFYSKAEPHHAIGRYAAHACDNLAVLVTPETRTTYETLQRLKLTIGTTDTWGDHPSLAFYFGKKMKFYYSQREFIGNLPQWKCAVVQASDSQDLKSYKQLVEYGDMKLYRITP